MDHNAYDTDIPFFVDVLEKNSLWSRYKKLIEDRIRKSCKCNYGKIHNEGSNEEEIDGHHNIGDLRYFSCKNFKNFSRSILLVTTLISLQNSIHPF